MFGHGMQHMHGIGKANLPRIEFPKDRFTLKDVHRYKETKLQYPNAYNLYDTKKDWILEFDKKLHQHHYGAYERTNATGNIRFGVTGLDDPRKYIRK